MSTPGSAYAQLASRLSRIGSLKKLKKKQLVYLIPKKPKPLQKLPAKAKIQKKYCRTCKQKINKLEEDLLKLDTEINKAAREHEAASIKVKEFESTNYNEPKVNPDEDKLKKEIDSLTLGTSEQKAAIEQDITNLSNLIKDIQELQAKKAANKRALERIKELEAKEKELAAEYEQLEGELFLTEEFIRTKVNLLEDKINSKFKLARFKLFNTQINGGIEECCEVMYKGVPYTDLNSAMKTNIGLDIINTLSEHYGFQAPIFVDNAESVTKLLPVNSQVIKLIVSEKDNTLRVEALANE